MPRTLARSPLSRCVDTGVDLAIELDHPAGMPVAVLRTPESWGMTFAVDVMATGHRRQKATAYDAYSIAE